LFVTTVTTTTTTKDKNKRDNKGFSGDDYDYQGKEEARDNKGFISGGGRATATKFQCHLQRW
jgi:hypothetical protein